MIFSVESGLDLALTYLLVCAFVGGVVTVALARTPGRALWVVVTGAALLALAAAVVIASVGATIELHLRTGLASSLDRDDWPTLLAVGLLVLGNVLVSVLGRPSDVVKRPPLTRTQLVRVLLSVLVVSAIAVFALPVLDCHWGWEHLHCHTYRTSGFHSH